MNRDSLAGKIKSKMEAIDENIKIDDDRFIKAISEAVIEEITQNSTITSTHALVAPPTGGPVTGSITNTIS